MDHSRMVAGDRSTTLRPIWTRDRFMRLVALNVDRYVKLYFLNGMCIAGVLRGEVQQTGEATVAQFAFEADGHRGVMVLRAEDLVSVFVSDHVLPTGRSQHATFGHQDDLNEPITPQYIDSPLPQSVGLSLGASQSFSRDNVSPRNAPRR